MIPIEIPADYKPKEGSDPAQIFEIPFAFFGPKHTTFGEPFTVKVQVQDGETELALFKAAITLAEAGMGTFD